MADKGGDQRRLAPVFSAIFSGIAILVSVCSAIYANYGLGYQRKQFAQTAFLEYAKFRESASGTMLQCAFFLLNEKAVRDKELQALWEGQPKYDKDLVYQPMTNFRYEKERHAGLKDCVDETDTEVGQRKAKELKELFDKPSWSAEETNDETRKVRASISDKVSKNINFLDIGLIGYKHGGGDKEVLCENFATYIMAGSHFKSIEYGILGRFVERLIRLQLIRDDNYPSLYAFIGDVSKATTDANGRTFVNRMNCRLLRGYPGQDLYEFFFGTEPRDAPTVKEKSLS
jgi:hypothetical protein